MTSPAHACGPSANTEAPIVPAFDLVDHAGRRVTLESFRGQHLLVFFGFTHCRMVCPRALGRLTVALDGLGPTADRIVPLYVTVDPERDDPETMRSFLSATTPRFTGLTGSVEEIEQAKRAFGVFTRRTVDTEGYAVPHTALTYVLTPEGRYLTHLGDGTAAPEIGRRLKQVLS